MASGLLASTATIAREAPTAARSRLAPSIRRSACSSRLRWSQVRYGSHSQPLIMTVSTGFSFGGESFTWVGKAAPPKPTMPASRTSRRISSADGSRPAGTSRRVSCCSSAVLMTIANWRVPVKCGRGSTATTTPAPGACTGAEMKASASPIFWPARTASPLLTSGRQGAPVCWLSGTINSGGSGISTTPMPAVPALHSAGWTPPLNKLATNPPTLRQTAFYSRQPGLPVKTLFGRQRSPRRTRMERAWASSPSSSAKVAAISANSSNPRRLKWMTLLRTMKSSTPRPEEKRAAPPVGRT